MKAIAGLTFVNCIKNLSIVNKEGYKRKDF